jgi:hypothetical protein
MGEQLLELVDDEEDPFAAGLFELPFHGTGQLGTGLVGAVAGTQVGHR